MFTFFNRFPGKFLSLFCFDAVNSTCILLEYFSWAEITPSIAAEVCFRYYSFEDIWNASDLLPHPVTRMPASCSKLVWRIGVVVSLWDRFGFGTTLNSPTSAPPELHANRQYSFHCSDWRIDLCDVIRDAMKHDPCKASLSTSAFRVEARACFKGQLKIGNFRPHLQSIVPLNLQRLSCICPGKVPESAIDKLKKYSARGCLLIDW